MTTSLKHFALSPAGLLVGAIIIGCALLVAVKPALANPSLYLTPTASATATSSVTFLSSTGQSTSTPIDAYTGTTQGFDKMALLVQDVASSTSSSLNIKFQFAIGINGNNCASSPSLCDWYDDNYYQTAATSTGQPLQVITPNSLQWVANVTSTSSKIFNVSTPTRYVRAVFTESGAAAGIWYAWQPVKQNP